MEINKATQHNIIADSAILYIGIFANLGVLIHLHKTWTSQNRVQFYVLTLCIADCLGLILRQCVEVGLHTTDTWNTGETGCKIVMSMSLTGTMLAHYMLVNCNIDNLITVLHRKSPLPVRYTLFIFALLLVGVSTGSQAFLYHIETHPIYSYLRQCTPFGELSLHQEMIYNIIVVAALFWIPATLIVISAVTVLVLMHKGFIPIHNKDDQPKRDLHSLTTDIIYVTALDCCFILCWIPYSVQQIFNATETWLFEKKTLLAMWDGFTYLSMINHCLNPIIYGMSCI